LKQVFNSFGCDGENRSPALTWSGAPAETRASRSTVYDPDAPDRVRLVAWIVYNIPADVSALPAGPATPTASSCRRAPSKAVPTSAPPTMAAPVRRRRSRASLCLHDPCAEVEKLDLPADPSAAPGRASCCTARKYARTSLHAYYVR